MSRAFLVLRQRHVVAPSALTRSRVAEESLCASSIVVCEFVAEGAVTTIQMVEAGVRRSLGLGRQDCSAHFFLESLAYIPVLKRCVYMERETKLTTGVFLFHLLCFQKLYFSRERKKQELSDAISLSTLVPYH